MTSASTRSTTTTTASKRAGVFEDLLIFCNKKEKKSKESGVGLENVSNLKLKSI